MEASRNCQKSKIRRNCILPPTDIGGPTESGDVTHDGRCTELPTSSTTPCPNKVRSTEHLVKTLLDQSHLCPLPLRVSPVYWKYDHALRLYPLPDVMVLADFYDQYLWCYEECVALNPGSFPTEFSFVVYRPASRGTEFSRV